MSEREVFIFEVSKRNFESVVIQNSFKLPVVVEFMGIWSGPCIQMSEEISVLAKEFSGQFIFAKVDIDEQAELVEKYSIKNVPSLKVFVDGEIVQTEEGQLKQNELRDVLKNRGIYSHIDEMRTQAREKHMAGETLAAIQLLTQAMQLDSSNVKTAMDMSQVFIDLHELDQAKSLYNQLPNSAKNSEMGKALLGQLAFFNLAEKTQGKDKLLQLLIEYPDNCDFHFDLAVCLIAEKNYEQAVSHLFDIMKIDTGYKDGAAKEMIVNVTNMLAPNNAELSGEFRQKLSSTIWA
ncbi:MAG TPA: tetratricopeptide repeat protein [Leucothrix mucor]|nr:tetratricopeptide repeat protein [Leucothrix mucor]